MNEEYLTSIDVCYMLGIAETTLKNWYKWYKIREIECPELPMPTKIKNRNYWHRNDLGLLFSFKQWVPKGRNGVMGVVNRKFWGKKKCGKECGNVDTDSSHCG